MSLETLAQDLAARATQTVTYHDWDAYILGRSPTLLSIKLPAGDVARREQLRFGAGRFPSLSLAVADAVFSKQAEYVVAVERVRNFASFVGTRGSQEVRDLGEEALGRAVYGQDFAAGQGPRPQHLSPAGRLHTIFDALAVFLCFQASDLARARAWASAPEGNPALAAALLEVHGLKEAMLQNIRMNLGALILKLDTHVRRVLAPHLGLARDAPAAVFAGTLEKIEGKLPWSAFEIDQLIWYTESNAALAKRNARRPGGGRDG